MNILFYIILIWFHNMKFMNAYPDQWNWKQLLHCVIDHITILLLTNYRISIENSLDKKNRFTVAALCPLIAKKKKEKLYWLK